MFEEIHFFVTFAPASIIIPLIIVVTKYHSLNDSQRVLSYLVMVAFITELVAAILRYSQMSNIIVYNIYTLFNFNLIFTIYFLRVKVSKRRLFRVLQIAFNSFAIINAIFLQSVYSFNSNLIVSMSLIFLSLALNHFFTLLREVKYQRLEKNPMFWISSGVIIYYSSTLVLFLLSNQINEAKVEPKVLAYASWGLNSFFSLILNTAYGIALWVKPVK